MCVCVCETSGEEKGKDGAELIFSVYQKLHRSVIEFSPSSFVVVFVSRRMDGWTDGQMDGSKDRYSEPLSRLFSLS